MSDSNTKKSGKPAKKSSVVDRSLLSRCITLLLVFVLAAGGLCWQLYRVQVKQSSQWLKLASQQQLKNIPITPVRGAIYDSDMKLLAQSSLVWTVEAAPDVLLTSTLKGDLAGEKDVAAAAARELARVLGLSETEREQLYENLSDKTKRWCKVKAQIDKQTYDEVRAMCAEYGIKGVYYQEDYKRYYPYEDLGSTLMGFVSEGAGREGLEYYYNEELTGTPGRRVAMVDARQNEITSDEAVTYPAEDGNSLVLTINAEIQEVLERHLANAVMEHSARERGMGIVMNVNTGEILGMAVYPAFNPNEPYNIYNEMERMDLEYIYDPELYARAQGEMRLRQWRNKALVDTYEPGSVLKIITAAAALDSGLYTEHDRFQCGAQIQVADREMGCAGRTNHGTPTLREALLESCNVSFIRMSRGMGKELWYDYLRAFGLTEPTGVDMPGEPSQASFNNVIYSPAQMGEVELASCSFGQSNKYTALQMITAVSAAVNGGNLMQPYIVKQVLDPQGNVIQNNEPVLKRQVISEETSAILRDILEELVSRPQGLGNRAYVAGYHVGGKSGTSQKLDILALDEEDKRYIASFLGIAPAPSPEVAVLIVLDEPEDPAGRYFGGRLAGPAVRNVISETMQILGIEPDYTEEDLARTTQSCPDVVSKSLLEAQQRLDSAGLTYTVVGSGDTVHGQYPVAYSQVPGRGNIVLYTDPAEPLRFTTVPDVTGRSGANAITALKNAGLNVVTTGALDSATGIIVLEQSEPGGVEVPLGSVITIVLDNPNAVEAH